MAIHAYVVQGNSQEAITMQDMTNSHLYGSDNKLWWGVRGGKIFWAKRVRKCFKEVIKLIHYGISHLKQSIYSLLFVVSSIAHLLAKAACYV